MRKTIIVRGLAALLAFTPIVYVPRISASSIEVDKSRVYYGNPDSFSQPGEISVQIVFYSIDEYKKIKKENLLKDDAKYWLLLQRANKKFQKTLENTAEKYGYDLIAEIGIIGTYKEKQVPDITGEVLDELSEIQDKERQEQTK